MATVKFYLKDPKSKGPTLLLVKYFSPGLQFKVSTGESVDPTNWNSKTQKVKKSHPDSADFNHFLSLIEPEFTRIRLGFISQKIELTSEPFKDAVKKIRGIDKPQTAPLSVTDALQELMDVKATQLSYNYLKSLKTLRNHLSEFERQFRKSIQFEDIKPGFADKLTTHLLGKGLINNTIACNYSRFKFFLKWAQTKGYIGNYPVEEFRVKERETDIVTLTEEELFVLLNLDLSNDRRLQNVRDTFCFGCFTGLRFSDIAQIRPHHYYATLDQIRGIRLTIQKTGETLDIPLADYAYDILSRNDFRLPVISNQKTNAYLKELGRLAGLNEMVRTTILKGAEKIENTFPKHALISTHTARRTFITIMLEKGVRAEIVMKFSGHKGFKSFKKYINITDKVKHVTMKQVWSKSEDKILKAV